ncbi:MAG: ATP synthase F1 subunit gamma [Candidatus Acidulodesulfobacterium acidiphilum]|uniref:ATP synthase gamma chain n=1 Tax=Candidatus Acidulodesulfobacterium acidiphilum TaxID=2597224 RepID=A0A520XGW8_9DELT|nr:MAG: ATP synthase F1 subunit gamma [Candidatus Acidulodesulfobacterium acidiphilum]
MPNLKSIKRKISSIKNTRQITKAMKMVAGSKFKKNQAAMNEYKAYASIYDNVVDNIKNNSVLCLHSFYGKNEGNAGRNIGIVIISTDRGLCGSFNINLFRLFKEEIKSKGLDEGKIKLYVLGKKAYDFFKKNNYNIVFGMLYSDGDSIMNITELLCDTVIKDFKNKEIDGVYIISNRYISTIQQRAYSEKLLPFEAADGNKSSKSGGYLIEETVDYENEVIDKIFNNYFRTKIYYKILESFAGEQASRMNAMDNATRNAGKLINKLTIAYNKARQTAVTLEILDIINGVNAVK